MSTKMAVWSLALVTTLVAMLIGCAWQGDVDTLSRRVYSLEQTSDRLSQQVAEEQSRYKEDQEDTRGRHASLHTVMDDVRGEMVQLRGQLEEMQYQIKRMEAGEQGLKRLEKMVQVSRFAAD